MLLFFVFFFFQEEDGIRVRVRSGGFEVWKKGKALLGSRLGERVGASDGRIVRDAMFGTDRRTGERIRVKMERNRHARIHAAPYFSVIAQACACLLYTSDAADERSSVDLGGRRIIKKKKTEKTKVSKAREKQKN